MRIAVCGGKGQLGSDCVQVLSQRHDVVALGSRELDITEPLHVKKMMRHVKPDIILNCAAYSKIDACESKRELALKVNVGGPKNLISCLTNGCGRLIHISTDYIFDGRKKPPNHYLEGDKPNPISYYGKTKLESEEILRETTCHYVILRAAWLYGINGQNFLKTVLRLAIQDPKREIRVVNDRYGSPTWSYRLALQISKLIETNGFGTYHATSEGYCTWYELATYFLGRMGVPHSLIPCTTAEYPTPAPRPMNAILENQHLKEEGVQLMPHWKSDVDRFVSMFKDRLLKEVKEISV